MAKNKEEEEFPIFGEDPELLHAYGEKDEVKSYRQVVLQAIEKCREEFSKEMTKGGEHMVFVENRWIPMNLPDQRKVCIQTVMTLYDLLFFTFDKIATDRITKLEKDLEDAHLKFLKKYQQVETWQPFKMSSQRTGIIMMGKQSPVGAIILQELEDYKMNLYRKIFRELLLLYKRKNELSKQRFLDPLLMLDGTRYGDEPPSPEVQAVLDAEMDKIPED